MNLGLPSSAADGLSPVSGDGLWQACVDQLAQELPEQQFNTWIKPLLATVAEDFSKVVILVGNRFSSSSGCFLAPLLSRVFMHLGGKLRLVTI